MENIGLHYYKEYYKGLNENLFFLKKPSKAEETIINDHFTKKNNFLKNLRLGEVYQQKTVANQIVLKMQVIESGLLIGTGNSHQTGSKGEYKLGFFFDHTTGLPIVPASSVKGVLRSFFEEKKIGYTLTIIKEILKIDGIDEQYLKKLEAHIFDGKDIEKNPIVIYKRDIFFDAFPSWEVNQKLFIDDVITPHKHKSNHKLDPFAEPTPISFMKIKAGVIFNFNFKLNDFEFEGIKFSKENKQQFFANLLEIGIGAKTNVGYGQLKPL